MWGTRPTAIRISAPSTLLPSLELHHHTGAAGADLLGLDAGADVDAEVLAQRLVDFIAGEGSSRASRCALPSTSVTLVPSDDQAWESSLPTGPPPSTIMLAGTCLEVVPWRLFQVSTVSSPSIGGIAAPLPVATITALRAVRTSSPTRRRRSPSKRACAAEEVDPTFFQPGQLAGVVEVVDHLVAAVEDRLRVELALASTGTPGTRRASPSTSAGRSSAFEGMQA